MTDLRSENREATCLNKTIFLIPGANPKAAKPIFDAIRASLKPDYEIVELEKANETDLLSKARKVTSKILVGKSIGGRIALDYQIKRKDSEALVLLAPAVKPDDRYSEIESHVLIIHGSKDHAIPIDNSRQMEKCFKNSKFVEIPGAGHGFEGKELETARIIAEWIGSLQRNSA